MKTIELKSLLDRGSAIANLSEDCIQISVKGINGCMKAWLVGNQNCELGNIVNGKIEKHLDTTPYSGILITQSGKHLFYGETGNIIEDASYKEEQERAEASEPEEVVTEIPREALSTETEEIPCEILSEESEETLPFNSDDGFTWQKITDNDYPDSSESVKYILSHKSVLNAFRKHKYYYFGRNKNLIAVAIPCDVKNEPHPLVHLSNFSIYKKPFFIICADLDKKIYYSYE